MVGGGVDKRPGKDANDMENPMSANLATTANEVMMAYQGETPWHQTGTEVIDHAVCQSVDAFLAAAHLDWEVQLKAMFYRAGDKSIRVPARRAVVRSTDGKLLATVGAGYQPFQNKDAFAVLQPALDRFGMKIATAGALGKGDKVWMLAEMPESIEPIPGDIVKNYMLVLTGHNGWTAHSARLTQVRVVCQNTISLAMQDEAFVKLRHVTSEVDKLTQVADIITGFMDVAKQTSASYTKLAGHKMTAAEITTYIESVLNLDFDSPVAARRRDRIVELATFSGKGIEAAPGTAWTAFNAVTEYVDHVRTAEGKSPKTIRNANQSALFGQNAKLKARALQAALKLVA
jgi:phage/plasmid-like protein (TIGR03299 family)